MLFNAFDGLGYSFWLVLAGLGRMRYAFARVQLQQRVRNACFASPVRCAVARFGCQCPCVLFLPDVGDVSVGLLFLALQRYGLGQQPQGEGATAAGGGSVAWRNVV